jgi:hypothetical protein
MAMIGMAKHGTNCTSAYGRRSFANRQYATLPAPAMRRGTRESLPVVSSILSIMKTAITEAKAIVI